MEQVETAVDNREMFDFFSNTFVWTSNRIASIRIEWYDNSLVLSKFQLEHPVNIQSNYMLQSN